MKSPYSGKEMNLHSEIVTTEYRGETFSYVSHYYLDEDTGDEYTTTESDTEDLNQIYDQYRNRHSIPGADEICRIRKRYGLSSSKMSKVLGFGPNQWRLYESGEVPSLSNARLISLAAHKNNMLELVEAARNELPDYEKVYSKVSASE